MLQENEIRELKRLLGVQQNDVDSGEGVGRGCTNGTSDANEDNTKQDLQRSKEVPGFGRVSVIVTAGVVSAGYGATERADGAAAQSSEETREPGET